MVTKPHCKIIQLHRQFCSSEKINGNKTSNGYEYFMCPFCSSEKINGNKTSSYTPTETYWFCSSEKINGNKTSNSYYHKFKIL